MALKQDCELVADRSSRILALIRMRQQVKIEIEENPDLELAVTDDMRAAWNAKVQAFKDEIKAVTGAW